MERHTDDSVKFELFERASKNLLPDAEKSDFEKRIQTDEVFKLEYEAFLESISIIDSLAFKEKVTEVLAKPKNGRKIWLLRLAAAAIIIFGLFQFIPSKITNVELFDELFSQAPDLLTNRNLTKSEVISAAMKAYNEKNYNLSNELFTQVAQKNDTILLYQSINHLGLYQSQESLSKLHQIKNSQLFSEKYWYLSLAHLLESNLDSVSYFLQKLNNTGSYESKRKMLMKHIE